MAIEKTRAETWSDFEKWVDGLRTEVAGLAEGFSAGVSTLIFRGHQSHEWSLQTTLERYPGAGPKVMDYFRAASMVKSSIESLTSQRWVTVEEPDFEKLFAGDAYGWGGKYPDYEYLIHLRHHGFPSPLLDWSRSPFVAAFFAFHHAKPENADVAIYAYLEYAGGPKTSSPDRPTIHGLGPHVTTHKRHVLQQADYTICVQHVDGVWRYAPHESADGVWDQFGRQDLLWKATLPATLRREVLQRLDSYNLNAFSLFQSEDSLMETMALRAFNSD